MKLIITRHGETKENTQGILQGHIPGQLSGSGIAQASALAERLREEKLDHIFTSDLARAFDTTLIIAKYHMETGMMITELLREQNLGEFEGKKIEDIEWTEENRIGSMTQPQHGETIEQLYRRAEKFITYIKNHFQDGVFLIVGHDGINRALLAVLEGKGKEDLPFEPAQRHTAYNEVNIDEQGNGRVLVRNCTKHLEENY